MEGWGLGGGVQPTIIFCNVICLSFQTVNPPPLLLPCLSPGSDVYVVYTYRGGGVGGWSWWVMVAKNALGLPFFLPESA